MFFEEGSDFLTLESIQTACPVKSGQSSQISPGRSEMTSDETGTNIRHMMETATKQ